MEPVRFATLYAPPRPLDLGNVSDLWLGDALTHNGEVRLYIKRAPAEEILSECLCAVVGTALGLPIPRAYLVADRAGHVTGGTLFGSEDAGAPSLHHYINRNDPAVGRALLNWQQLQEAALFDEWIANPDRNQQNLLWDGHAEWLLIDHARAMGAEPPGRPVPPPDYAELNQLAHLLVDNGGEIAAQRLLKIAAPFASRARALDASEVSNAARGQHIDVSGRLADALSFLQARIDHLPALLRRYGSHPDLLA